MRYITFNETHMSSGGGACGFIWLGTRCERFGADVERSRRNQVCPCWRLLYARRDGCALVLCKVQFPYQMCTATQSQTRLMLSRPGCSCKASSCVSARPSTARINTVRLHYHYMETTFEQQHTLAALPDRGMLRGLQTVVVEEGLRGLYKGPPFSFQYMLRIKSVFHFRTIPFAASRSQLQV